METRNTEPDTRTDKVLCKALVALAAGVLLGVLVTVPYDRLLGLPVSTCAVLRSAVSVALLGALHIGRVRNLHLELNETPARTPRSSYPRVEQVGAALRVLWEQSRPLVALDRDLAR